HRLSSASFRPIAGWAVVLPTPLRLECSAPARRHGLRPRFPDPALWVGPPAVHMGDRSRARSRAQYCRPVSRLRLRPTTPDRGPSISGDDEMRPLCPAPLLLYSAPPRAYDRVGRSDDRVRPNAFGHATPASLALSPGISAFCIAPPRPPVFASARGERRPDPG